MSIKQRLSKDTKLLWLPLIIWVIVVCYFSFSTSVTKVVPEIKAIDKVGHFIMYALMEVFIYLPLKRNRKSFNLYTLFTFVFAGFTEVVQHFFIAGRSGEVYDFVANILGASVVYFILIGKIK